MELGLMGASTPKSSLASTQHAGHRSQAPSPLSAQNHSHGMVRALLREVVKCEVCVNTYGIAESMATI